MGQFSNISKHRHITLMLNEGTKNKKLHSTQRTNRITLNI